MVIEDDAFFAAARSGRKAPEMVESAETVAFSEEFEMWASNMQGRAAERIRQVRAFVPRGDGDSDARQNFAKARGES